MIHHISTWLCDGCLDGVGCDPVPGCVLCVARNSKLSLRKNLAVQIDGFKWEGCPVCRVADSGGWAVRRGVDTSKCESCDGAGLVRVRFDSAVHHYSSYLGPKARTLAVDGAVRLVQVDGDDGDDE